MTLATPADEVERLFASRGAAGSELAKWKQKRPHVASRVMQHVSVTPYQVASDQLRTFRPRHPLAQITQEEGYRVATIRDWFPDFAMVHLFHFLLEEKGGLFTYDEFRTFCKTDEAGRHFNHQAQDKITELVEHERWELNAATDAMKWRVGNSYYSFLREIYLIARLREAGIDARIHPLADALFRVDTWCGRATVEMFVANSNFKQGQTGRKRTPEHYLGDQPGFGYLRLEMAKQHKWGVLHLPTDEEIDRCIADVRSWLSEDSRR